MDIRKDLFAVILAVASMLSCVKSAPVERLASFHTTEYHFVDSELLGRGFHVFIRLPGNYDESDASHPTVYLLDGDVTFPMIAALQPLLEFDEPEIPVPIIIGIAYGTFDSSNGNFRGVDFTAPTPDDSGGADRFQAFLKEDLIPQIEAQYRSDPAARILVGQSRGGHFALYSALTDPDLFWGRISINPAMSPAQDFFIQDHDLPASDSTALYVSSGTNDIPAFREDALRWNEAWSAREHKPWRLKFVTADGETHASGYANAYRAGMKWLFGVEASTQIDQHD